MSGASVVPMGSPLVPSRKSANIDKHQLAKRHLRAVRRYLDDGDLSSALESLQLAAKEASSITNPDDVGSKYIGPERFQASLQALKIAVHEQRIRQQNIVPTMVLEIIDSAINSAATTRTFGISDIPNATTNRTLRRWDNRRLLVCLNNCFVTYWHKFDQHNNEYVQRFLSDMIAWHFGPEMACCLDTGYFYIFSFDNLISNIKQYVSEYKPLIAPTVVVQLEIFNQHPPTSLMAYTAFASASIPLAMCVTGDQSGQTQETSELLTEAKTASPNP